MTYTIDNLPSRDIPSYIKAELGLEMETGMSPEREFFSFGFSFLNGPSLETLAGELNKYYEARGFSPVPDASSTRKDFIFRTYEHLSKSRAQVMLAKQGDTIKGQVVDTETEYQQKVRLTLQSTR